MSYPITDGTATLTSHAQFHNAVVDVKAHYGATGDGVTNDYSAVAAAVTAAGVGGTVFFPSGTYLVDTGLAPLTAQRWIGTGMARYDGVAGTIIKYSGTGKAMDMTDVNNFGASDMMIQVTDTAATAYYRNGTNFDHLTNVTLDGAGASGSSYGIKSEGSVGCQCHGRFMGVQINGFATGLSLSGFSNGNLFSNCHIGATVTGIDFTPTASDTSGGDDNLFERSEMTTMTTGVRIASTSDRNMFLKLMQDGTFTTAFSIGSGCSHTVLVGCRFEATFTDAGTETGMFLCTGPGLTNNVQEGLIIGDTNLYRTGTNALKTDDAFTATGALASDAAVTAGTNLVATQGGLIGGYAGSLRSSAGLGVFGNSEFSNALAIGGALNHDGTTIGFYGTTPIVKQTGVAVTAAGVHAALVNLGLISA